MVIILWVMSIGSVSAFLFFLDFLLFLAEAFAEWSPEASLSLGSIYSASILCILPRMPILSKNSFAFSLLSSERTSAIMIRPIFSSPDSDTLRASEMLF